MEKFQEAQLESDAQESASELIGRQSVRVTFRLSAACINAISILATHLGIKQKSVFDHLMEKTQVLHEIAKDLEKVAFDRETRTQKTFVISRRSLLSLEKISGDFNMPRDALIEYSVQRLLPIILKEREKHEFRKQLFSKTERHFYESRELLKNAQRLLGSEDPLTRRLNAMMATYENVFDELKAFIEKGKRIEAFEAEGFGWTEISDNGLHH